MTTVSVVVPVFQNDTSLAALADRLIATMDQSGYRFEVLLVDDGSRDNSWAIIREACKDSRIRAVRLSRNFGQHPALCAGFRHAAGNYIVMMDADLQDYPENIPHLVEPLINDTADLVCSVHHESSHGALRRYTSRMFHYAFARLTRNVVPRHIGTMRAFNRKVLRAILQYGERHVLYGPLTIAVGFRQAFVLLDRGGAVGRSSYTFLRRLNLAAGAILTWTDLPIRVLLHAGWIIATGAITYLLGVLAHYAVYGRAVAEGVTIVIVLVCLLTGVAMLALGIVGGYVFQIYQEVLARPRYHVAESVNVDRVISDGPAPFDLPVAFRECTGVGSGE